MRLFIRADANTQIGTGHIMRCIALAQAWQDQGGQVTFLTHCTSEPLRQRIQVEGFEFVPIDHANPDSSDLKKTIEVIKPQTPICEPPAAKPWLCLDGYHFTPDYQKAIRDAGIRLLVIDDMNHLPHYHADILLNQNIHAPDLHYFCDPDTTLLLGTRYVLLRREFMKYKGLKREIPEKAKKIIVTMGGADPDNATLKVFEAIKLLNDPDLDVKIIIGPSNPNIEIIKRSMLHAQCPMRCVENATHMPDLMAWADLAITAAGSTCWELAFMGVPFGAIVLAENQAQVASALKLAGVSRTLDTDDSMSVSEIASQLRPLLRSRTKRKEMSRLGSELIPTAGNAETISMLKDIHLASCLQIYKNLKTALI